MAYLLDTNIISELRKGSKADQNVIDWAYRSRNAQHFISVLSLGEIRKGIEILRRKAPDQCSVFETWLSSLTLSYHECILYIDEEVSDTWGRINSLQTLPVIDGLIAATAMTKHLTLVTRNVKDFPLTGIQLINPFDEV